MQDACKCLETGLLSAGGGYVGNEEISFTVSNKCLELLCVPKWLA